MSLHGGGGVDGDDCGEEDDLVITSNITTLAYPLRDFSAEFQFERVYVDTYGPQWTLDVSQAFLTLDVSQAFHMSAISDSDRLFVQAPPGSIMYPISAYSICNICERSPMECMCFRVVQFFDPARGFALSDLVNGAVDPPDLFDGCSVLGDVYYSPVVEHLAIEEARDLHVRGMGLVLCELWQYHDDRRIHRRRLSSALSQLQSYLMTTCWPIERYDLGLPLFFPGECATLYDRDVWFMDQAQIMEHLWRCSVVRSIAESAEQKLFLTTRQDRALTLALSHHLVVPDVSLETLAQLKEQIAAARMTVSMPINNVAVYQSRIVAVSDSAFSRQDGA